MPDAAARGHQTATFGFARDGRSRAGRPSVRDPKVQGEAPPRAGLLRELLTFLILAVLIWPFIAVGVVSGWGFLVWMYYAFTGPPGPV